MKKTIPIALALIFLAIVLFLFRIIFGGPEDGWVCVDNQWTKHGNPSVPAPTSGCGAATSTNGQPTEKDIAYLTNVRPGDSVSSVLRLEGEARGNWYFEASFPVELVDGSGNILAQHYAQAQSDWMTTEYVPFRSEIEFNVATDTPGFIVLKKDNPSGLPENEDERRIPVVFKAGVETIAIRIYFGLNMSSSTENSCDAIYYVNRFVPRTLAVGRAAIEELLKGPTQEEKDKNYFTSINDGVKLNSLTIENGVAKVDFDKQMQYQLGGSCRVSAIRSQIENTLKQFPTVQSVIISVDGNVEEALQP